MPQQPALTPAFLRALRPPATGQKEYADKACPGLRLRLSHGGAATWLLGCRDTAGRSRRFVLGAFPGVGLATARDMARERREEVRQGRDPIKQAREARQVVEPVAAATLVDLLDGYQRDVGLRKRSWPESRRRIESVFAKHLARAVGTITAPELQLTVDAHPSRKSGAAAVRYVRPVLKWGLSAACWHAASGRCLTNRRVPRRCAIDGCRMTRWQRSCVPWTRPAAMAA